MSWNPNNNTFIMNPQNNNPWGNQDQMQPSGQNWQQVFGNPMNSNPGGASTMPVGQPDIYGGGSLQQFGQNSYQQFQPLSFSPDNPGGSYQPTQFNQLNPIGQGLGQGGFGSIDQMNRGGGLYGNSGLSPVGGGSATYTPGFQPTGQFNPVGGGTGNPYGNWPHDDTNPNSYLQYAPQWFQEQLGVGGGKYGIMNPAGGGVNPDAAYPKFDPGFLSQVQAALESPNGPYANRQVGDYAPDYAPANVQNPQTEKDWQDRFYWMAVHPEALANPSAPRNMAQQQVGTVPWQQFTKDVYSDVNANRSFNELSGVVDDARLQQAQTQYGWQLGPSGLQSNDAAVAQATAMKQAHPEYSYQVYQRPDGTYGIAARELDQKAQQERGFYAPGMAPKPAAPTYSGGGGSSRGYSSGGYSKSSGGGGGGSSNSQPNATAEMIAKLGGQATYDAIQKAKQMPQGKPLTPSEQEALNNWAKTHPYSGPYAPQYMPPASTSTGTKNPPAGTMSPDGSSIWDGTKWVKRAPQTPPANQQNLQKLLDAAAIAGQAAQSAVAPAPLPPGTPYGMISNDGKWRWDGTQWRPA